MSTPLELVAEGPDELAIWIEYENRRVILQVGSTLMDDVNVARFVDGDVVRGLPSVLFGKFCPVVMNLEAVLSLPDDQLLGLTFLCYQHCWSYDRGCCCGRNEVPTRKRFIIFHDEEFSGDRKFDLR